MKDFQNLGVKLAINRDEQILWIAKPYKKCFILESIFNPLLPFALAWLWFDLSFISMFMKAQNATQEITGLIIPFFLLHLMPVWMYIGGVLLTFNRYKNTEFAITNKAIYVSGGSLNFHSKIEKYNNIQSIQIQRGFIDQILGVGDVVITLKSTHRRKSKHGGYIVNDKIEIIDVHDYENVLDIIQNQIAIHQQTQVEDL